MKTKFMEGMDKYGKNGMDHGKKWMDLEWNGGIWI